jgi:hypothetical protein
VKKPTIKQLQARKLIERLVSLNTSHVLASDHECFNNSDCPSLVIPTSYGWIVCVRTLELLETLNISNKCFKLLKWAHDIGLQWVQFDVDGVTLDEFETFDW